MSSELRRLKRCILPLVVVTLLTKLNPALAAETGIIAAGATLQQLAANLVFAEWPACDR